MFDNKMEQFIQANSPDGGFLQSEEWRKFQESYGRKTFNLEGDGFRASIIEHKLKIVGKYFYVPRGPVMTCNPQSTIHNPIPELIELAKKEKAGWIRIEPADQKTLQNILKNTCPSGRQVKNKIVKAPHDMQPKEIFVIDIKKPEEQLLAEMKAKTRYNIKLAQKKGISLRIMDRYECPNNDFEEFLKLVKITAQRNEICAHPEEYYRKMWETIPAENLKLYVAKYQDKIIAANLVLYYGKFATYLHGASDNDYREVMAPYLLQWQAIRDAKKRGCDKYDFGGTSIIQANKLQGVTKFKTGFSPITSPIEFPGSYDIIIDNRSYYIYRLLQLIKNFLR